VRIAALTALEDAEVALISLDPEWTAEAAQALGAISDLVLFPGGGLAVVDPLNARVHVFHPDGSAAASFGQIGEGPGELSEMGLSDLIATDSSVIVPDLQHQRLSEFDREGRLIDTRTFPGSPLYAPEWSRHPGGGLIYRTLEPEGDRLVHLTDQGGTALYGFEPLNAVPNALLPPSALWAVGAAGELAVGRSDRDEVRWLAPGSSEPQWIARGARQTVGLNEAGRAAIEELLVEALRVDPMPGMTRADLLAAVTFPEVAPLRAGLLIDPQGFIWWRRAAPIEAMTLEALRVGHASGFGGAVWDVLTRDGLYNRTVRFPDGFTPFVFDGDWIYGVWVDSLDVPSVRRAR